MKKSFIFILITITLLIFIGCASTPENFKIEEYGPISIIEMYTNSQVSIYEDYDDTSGFISKYIDKIRDSEKPLSTMRLGQLAEAKFLDAIEGNKAFLSKEETTNVRAYVKQEKSGIRNNNQARVLEGYKLFNENDSQKVAYILKELNAKTAMWIDFEFNKIIPDQIERDIRWGDVHALVTMKVQLKNIKGKTLYKKEFQGISSGFTHATSGSMKEEEQIAFAELFPDVIDEVILKFLEDVNLTAKNQPPVNIELPAIETAIETETVNDAVSEPAVEATASETEVPQPEASSQN